MHASRRQIAFASNRPSRSGKPESWIHNCLPMECGNPTNAGVTGTLLPLRLHCEMKSDSPSIAHDAPVSEPHARDGLQCPKRTINNDCGPRASCR